MQTRRDASRVDVVLIIAALLLSICLSPVFAQSTSPVERDDTPFPELPDWLEFTGQFEIEVTREQNFDLEPTPNDRRHLLRPELQFEIEIQAHENIAFFFLTELSHELAIQDDTDEDEPSYPTFLFKEAHITIEALFGVPLSLQIGRQVFDDEREWLYDNELDALRLRYRWAKFRLEAFVGRIQFLDENFIRGKSRDGTDYFQLYAQYEVDEFLTLAAYSLVQDDNMSMGERPVFFGLRANGEWEPGRTDWLGLTYWIDAAHVRGESEGIDVRGWGLDAGFIATFDVAGELSVIFAYAFGSGDGDEEDGTDHAYRQTGLQGNGTALGSVTDIQYYGELLDPELSNLHIRTVGLGLRPIEPLSLTLLYHAYRQDQRSDELRDVSIDAEPTGLSHDIGSEIDLIGGWVSDAFELELVFGIFFPGNAFSSKTDNAFFAQFTLTVPF